MKLITLVILLFLSTISLNLFAQKYNYYVKGDTLVVGGNVLNEGRINNAKYCYVREKNTLTKLSPYEVSEYAIKETKIYLAKDITINGEQKRVFLERLSNNGRLLFYKADNINTFFFEEENGELTEVVKDSFKDKLKEFRPDCESVDNDLKLVKYTRHSIKKFAVKYNDKCDIRPFSIFRWGIISGTEFVKLRAKGEGLYSNTKYKNSFLAGLFIDCPLGVITNWSFHSEILYSKLDYEMNIYGLKKELDLSSIKIPALLRYKFSSKKQFSFFINGGVYYIHHLGNSKNNTKYLDHYWKLIAQNQYGYSIGGGLEYKLSYKNSLFLDLRYTNQLSLEDTYGSALYGMGGLKSSVFHLSLGINI